MQCALTIPCTTIPALLISLLCAVSPPTAFAAQTEASSAVHPLPRGFDVVDERGRAPQGFAQNLQQNSLNALKNVAEDGDFAVITAQVKTDLGQGVFAICDAEGQCMEATLSPQAQPQDQTLQAGQRYQMWIQAERNLLSLNLQILIFQPIN